MIQNESHHKHLEGEEEDTRHNRVIGKVRRKTQHLNTEFGHTQGEIFIKKPAKKSTSTLKGGGRNPGNNQSW
jgi:hypothetical protein